MFLFYFFFFKQKTAYEIMPSLVGSEMCIRDRRAAVHARGRPQPREPTHGRHAGDRVDLVDEHAAVILEEEVAARETAAVEGREGGGGQRPDLGLFSVSYTHLTL